ncbi:MAG: hypothetical protein A2Y62_18365 [Candidatus Fischerbacteria bacterium RBG_13_37_8]|uniref:Bulb-type lectin domain-containing protein n=1 Tax=Candidatus Fischerbacteria bacterium RBG_13_37_8 TaxID=1817863 RepID=A0A1F5VWY8_9BACT|nr:MAG: hypothetical protein A2Y62_18365 [Candidatus Fischerbacteria bacterium RBG_13_37_8]
MSKRYYLTLIKIIGIACVLILFFYNVYLQAQLITWARNYGGVEYEEATAIQQTSDAGYIISGYVDSSGSGNCDFLIIKMDMFGEVEWQKTYGGAADDEVYAIQETNDRGYIVAGFTNSFGAGNYDFWVLKLNEYGTIVWQRTYGGSYTERAWTVQQTGDLGYIVAGSTQSFGGWGSMQYFFLKLDSDGEILWQKTYDALGYDAITSIQQTNDKGYIAVGTSQGDFVGLTDF